MVTFHERYEPGKVERRVADDHEELYAFLLPRVKGDFIFDAGCGVGRFANMLAREGRKVFAADIERCIKHYHPNIAFSQKDLDLDAIGVGVYDSIVCLQAIEHFRSVPRVLKKFYNALGDEGELWVSSIDKHVRRHDAYENPHHISEMSAQECAQAIREAGFSIVGMYGQRPTPSWRTRPTLLNKVGNRIFGRPEESSSPKVRLWRRTHRYYTIHAIKK